MWHLHEENAGAVSILNKAYLLSTIGAGSTVFMTRDGQAGVKHRIGVNPHCTN